MLIKWMSLVVAALGVSLTSGAAIAAATAAECSAALNSFLHTPMMMSPRLAGPYARVILFNKDGGAPCLVARVDREKKFVSSEVEVIDAHSPLATGDELNIGLVLLGGESLPGATIEMGNCTPERPFPAPYTSDGGKPAVAPPPGAAAMELRWLASVSCGSEQPTIKLVDSNNKKVNVDATLQQYSRYRASLNLGVLNSRPLNPNFSERKGVIVEGEADKRGPEYVAAMVIHGLPHYLSSWLSTFDEKTSWSYKGRDLVHDHHWKDKIGLVIAAGTSDPAKRFGVGLSFELFNGVSLLGVREFAKSQVLDGVNLGDAIASGSTVPTKTEWRRSWSFGLAFDLSYVSKVFALKF